MNKSMVSILLSGLLLHGVEAQANVERKSKADKTDKKQTFHIPLKALQRAQPLANVFRKDEVALTDKHNTQYYGSFTLGSSRQSFSAILDTGSSNICRTALLQPVPAKPASILNPAIVFIATSNLLIFNTALAI